MKKIIVKNVSKNFKIGFEKNQGVLARFISFFSGKTPQRNQNFRQYFFLR